MKLSDASWVAPLLQAVADGGTLQYRFGVSSPWKDWDRGNINFDCDYGKEGYRIKPVVPQFRLFLNINEGAIVTAQRDMPGRRGDTSNYDLEAYTHHIQCGRGKWLTDWQPIPNL